MKKTVLLSALALVALVACNKEGKEFAGQNTSFGDSFITVKIAPTDVTGTKARSEGSWDGLYESSQSTAYNYEIKVTDAIFVLFKDGVYNTAVAKDAAELEAWTDEDKHTDDVKSQVTLVLSGVNSNLPNQIVALLNTGYTVADVQGKSLAQLAAFVQENLPAYNSTDKKYVGGDFVYSNSVYSLGGTPVLATEITEDHICKSEADALAHPVEIHVERVVAGIDLVQTAVDGTTTAIDTEATTSTGQTIGLEIDGFWIDNYAKKANLVKDIAGISENTFTPAWSGWNDYANYRSYWGKPLYKKADGLGHSKYTANKAVRQYVFPYIPEDGDTDVVTSKDYQDANVHADATQIVVAAHLKVGEDNVDLVKYQGTYYTVDVFKTVLANLAVVKQYYKKVEASETYTETTVDEDGTVTTTTKTATETAYYTLDASDLEIKYNVADQTRHNQDTNADTDLYGNKGTIEQWEGNFSVTITYDGTLYTRAGDTFTEATVADKNVANITVPYWNDGKTYFYLPIKHNGALNVDTEGYYGIIRNHLYKIYVQSISGLGTPVPFDDEYIENDETEQTVIIPQKPKDEKYYIAADIVILQWKVVSNNYNFD